MPSTVAELPLVARAREHGDRLAIHAPEGLYSYRDLLAASAAVAAALLQGRDDLNEARIAFLLPPGFRYAAVQWGIWRAGGVAVPLATSHPPRELEYVLDDAAPTAVVVDTDLEGRLRSGALAREILVFRSDQIVPLLPPSGDPDLPAIDGSRRALILYTSGTTGSPKGVVTTHANLKAQVESLVEAWDWRANDHILLVLPLHHVHGIVNVLTCALWSGGCCQILPGFDAEACWDRIARGDLTLFMAVPTIYARLLASWEAATVEVRRARTEGCRRMRLMVSGSAALPVSLLEGWKGVSGHTLLERYGMTEIGMALSNPLEGERRPGFVGTPLPGVEVRLGGDAGEEAPPGTDGEILVRGPTVFREYWGRPRETAEAFRDGWFLTGDVARIERESYRILGRRSIDIIKTGGYKVSAFEVEEVLREHPEISECAVVAIPDPEWGERVGVAIVSREGGPVEEDAIRRWAKERLAPYKVPSLIRSLSQLPRNAMGKVLKGEVAKLFDGGAP